MGITYELRGLLTIGLPIWVVTRIITLIRKNNKGIKIDIMKEINLNLFVVYLFILVGITIFPIHIGGKIPHMQGLSIVKKFNIHLIPFIDYFKGGIRFANIIKNIVGNIILLVPFILYLSAKNENIRNLKSFIKIALFISLSIESVQLFMNIFGISDMRAVHMEDVILNTLGGVIAWLIFKFMYKGKIKSIIDYTYLESIKES